MCCLFKDIPETVSGLARPPTIDIPLYSLAVMCFRHYEVGTSGFEGMDAESLDLPICRHFKLVDTHCSLRWYFYEPWSPNLVYCTPYILYILYMCGGAMRFQLQLRLIA